MKRYKRTNRKNLDEFACYDCIMSIKGTCKKHEKSIFKGINPIVEKMMNEVKSKVELEGEEVKAVELGEVVSEEKKNF